MGALDSACNRTCAGQSWINNYVSTLAEAPQYIQDLVQQAPETERFRFGMALCFLLLAGELVLIWSSAVDVPSLRRLCHALARSLTAPHMLVVHDQL